MISTINDRALQAEPSLRSPDSNACGSGVWVWGSETRATLSKDAHTHTRFVLAARTQARSSICIIILYIIILL